MVSLPAGVSPVAMDAGFSHSLAIGQLPLKVTVAEDDGSISGSLSMVLSQARAGPIQNVLINLPGHQIYLRKAVTIPKGVSLLASCDQPVTLVPSSTLNGQPLSRDGLILSGDNTLQGLIFTNIKQTGISMNLNQTKGNHVKCLVVRYPN